MDPLEAELDRAPWVYPWQLRDGRVLPVPAELQSVHETRAEMIQARVRSALAGENSTALDVACNEGWFSHHLLDWGASKVLGLDLRDHNIRRATLMRDHLGISPERLELRQADIFETDPKTLGTFDVVLVLGLIYHVENPMGVLRLARACTRGVCVIETQLTQQVDPIIHGNGRSGDLRRAQGSFAVVIETGDNPLASSGRVLSLVPNRAALIEMVRMAGFEHFEFAAAAEDHNLQYVDGNRAVIFAS